MASSWMRTFRIPWGAEVLEGIEEALSAWVEDLADPETSRPMWWEECRNALAQGQTLSGLMRRWLHRWYAREGLLVFDAGRSSPQDVCF